MTEAPEKSTTQVLTLRFECPQCGGQLTFDASSGLLRCEACGRTESIAKEAAQETIVEYDLEAALEKAPAMGLGLPTKSSSCQTCGAVVAFAAAETATRCSFCGSSHVLELDSHRQILRPESLLPFSNTKAEAQTQFRSWIHSLWFRPNNLKKLASVSQIQGVYIPYWVFDATIASDWSAMAGHHYYTTETSTEMVNGQLRTVSKQVQHTRWVPASGARRDVYDDHLICASRGLPAGLAKRLDTFKTSELKRYDPSYMAGWKAEEYQLDLKAAWKEAVHELEASQYNRCGRDVPGDTHTSLRVRNEFSETRFKHVLLPIWIAAYRYHDKTFQFLVNGQTGEVEGHAPYSVWKITFAVFCALLLLALAFFLFYGNSSGSSYQSY